MKRAFFFLGIAFYFVLSSCKKENPAPDLHLPSNNYSNVAYGDDALQVLDIFLPEGRSTQVTKTIFIIHGGGWTGGDKQEMTDPVNYLKSQLPDYAFVNVNYRLAAGGQTNVFPAQEEDIKTAVAFYLNKAGEYRVSKDILMGGVSAGAHLALLHGYKNDPEKHVKAIIDFYGPTDLVALWNMGLFQQFSLITPLGGSLTDHPDLYVNSSPVNYVSMQSPPTIVLQGGADPIVVPDQATRLIAKLNQFGVKNELVYYPSESHGWTGMNLLDSYNKIIAFVKENGK